LDVLGVLHVAGGLLEEVIVLEDLQLGGAKGERGADEQEDEEEDFESPLEHL
jgi:hypothetical protein